jgi:acyl-CoA thioester hydrolase
VPTAARRFEIQVRVAYADTDQMAVVYHANYLVWFERGRTEAIRELGLPYAALEARGIRLPVVEARVRYREPARYDDLLTVETTVADLTRARIVFDYRVRRTGDHASGDLVTGTTEHAFVGPEGRVLRVPDDLRAVIEPIVAGAASRRTLRG